MALLPESIMTLGGFDVERWVMWRSGRDNVGDETELCDAEQ